MGRRRSLTIKINWGVRALQAFQIVWILHCIWHTVQVHELHNTNVWIIFSANSKRNFSSIFHSTILHHTPTISLNDMYNTKLDNTWVLSLDISDLSTSVLGLNNKDTSPPRITRWIHTHLLLLLSPLPG